MKRVIIRNLKGIQTHGAVMEDPQAWIEDCVKNNYWGLPERLEYDENGNAIGNLPAEYTISIEDVTNESMLEVCIANRKAEYPTMEQFLNAYFDGGESALQELQAKRLAIKTKYPKP